MKQTVLIPAMAALATAFAAAPALAHNTFTSMVAPAGYVQDLEMRVTHGCKGSPVNAVKIKIPEGVTRVTVNMVRDWKVETKMRKLPKPVTMEGGVVITETIDEIIWKNPKSPLPANGRYESFRFRASLPNTPGAILYFRTITVCEQGDEPYVDVPKTRFDANSPDMREQLTTLMTATPFPSPFLILEKPARPQYPFNMPAPK